MSRAASDPPSDSRLVETVFLGKSPWKVCSRLLLAAVGAGAVTAAFAASVDFRTWLRVEQSTAPWAAALSGGVATILLVCAGWQWNFRVRWVGVSSAALRWNAGRGLQVRRWDQYVGLQRGTIEMAVYGEEFKAGRYADVQFKSGRPLRVSTDTVEDYEDLIAVIQTTARSSVKIFVAAGRSHGGVSGPVTTHGPLRLDETGIGWGNVHYRWDEIECYEVAVGYLRIQPAGGPEFLRRLSELGDWKPAVARLDANAGSRRVGARGGGAVESFSPLPASGRGAGGEVCALPPRRA